MASRSKLKGDVASTWLGDDALPRCHVWMTEQAKIQHSQQDRIDHSGWFSEAESVEPTAITLFVWPDSPVIWIGANTGNSESSSSYYRGNWTRVNCIEEETNSRHLKAILQVTWPKDSSRNGHNRQVWQVVLQIGQMLWKTLFCLFASEPSVQGH